VDTEISPTAPNKNAGAHRANAHTRISSSIAPWESESPIPSGNRGGVGNHRKELGVLEMAGGRSGGSGSRKIPTINHQPPTASSAHNPWNTPNGNIPMPSSVFGNSFYNDSFEALDQLSPGFKPGSSQEDMHMFPGGEDRRPSIASATTVSSSNSKSSVGRNFQKKLQGFFGEDFPGLEHAKQGSDPSLPASTTPTNNSTVAQRARNRNNSTQNNTLDISRPTSPSSLSRPHTPHASNEVTPWEFQDVNSKVRDDFMYMTTSQALGSLCTSTSAVLASTNALTPPSVQWQERLSNICV
jgi:adenylate cyclase